MTLAPAKVRKTCSAILKLSAMRRSLASLDLYSAIPDCIPLQEGPILQELPKKPASPPKGSKRPSSVYTTSERLRLLIKNGPSDALWLECHLLCEKIARSFSEDIRDDCIQEATMKCVAVARGKRIDLGKNVFSYLTAVAFNEMRRFYNKELRHFKLESLDVISDEE
jgi:hypothetical protein